MNSFLLMAEVAENPQLRYTPERVPVTDFVVEFASPRDDSRQRLKVTGWRDLAEEIERNYRRGDRLVLEGRLHINTLEKGDRKEKQAEMVLRRVYRVGEAAPIEAAPARAPSPKATMR
ncbi:MAG: single-stranded DNA-binding protein [Oscillatoriales cyanobacterium SM2_1_8]|nr:single-stranded DNA-binding protein [Oscillatoriales cyanobacterium SM2_1_8]